MDSYNDNNEKQNEKHFDYEYIKRNQMAPIPVPANSFETTAKVLGIISIISAVFGTIYPPFILGGLAILLAWLSHGGEKKLSSAAKTGIITAVLGLTINLAVIGGVLYAVFALPEYRQELNRVYEEMYGQSFDEAIDEILNDSTSSYPGGDF